MNCRCCISSLRSGIRLIMQYTQLDFRYVLTDAVSHPTSWRSLPKLVPYGLRCYAGQLRLPAAGPGHILPAAAAHVCPALRRPQQLGALPLCEYSNIHITLVKHITHNTYIICIITSTSPAWCTVSVWVENSNIHIIRRNRMAARL